MERKKNRVGNCLHTSPNPPPHKTHTHIHTHTTLRPKDANATNRRPLTHNPPTTTSIHPIYTLSYPHTNAYTHPQQGWRPSPTRRTTAPWPSTRARRSPSTSSGCTSTPSGQCSLSHMRLLCLCLSVTGGRTCICVSVWIHTFSTLPASFPPTPNSPNLPLDQAAGHPPPTPIHIPIHTHSHAHAYIYTCIRLLAIPAIAGLALFAYQQFSGIDDSQARSVPLC